MSALMISAYYAGLKGETRRIIDCPKDTTSIRWVKDHEMVPKGLFTGWAVECGAPLLLPLKCRYGIPGDELWFRENWRAPIRFDEHAPALIPMGTRIRYESKEVFKNEKAFCDLGKLRTSRFMCKWMARARHIPILDIQAERLQDITEEGAENEGVDGWCPFGMCNGLGVTQSGYVGVEPTICKCANLNYHEVYKLLWETINGPGSWERNDWVFVIKFPLYKKP